MYLYGIGHAMVDIFCFPGGNEEPREDGFSENGAPTEFEFPAPLVSGGIVHVPPEELDALLAKLQTAVRGFVPVSGQNCVSGGTAANILKTAAALGGTCFFSGTAGSPLGIRDDYSLFFQKELASYGVQAALRHENTATGRFLTVIAGKRRALAGSPGAAKFIKPEQIDRTALNEADYVAAEGMLCLNAPVWEKLTDCLRGTKKQTLVIDAATPFAAEKLYGPLSRIAGEIPLIFFANETEADCLARGAQNAAEQTKPAEFAEIAARFTTNGNRTLFIEKLGKRGARLWQNGKASTVSAVPRQAADATGAGDAFAGAFLTALAGGASPEQAAASANNFAATILNRYGCKPQKQS